MRDTRPMEGGGRVLTFELIDLLRLVEREGRDLAWAAFGLEVVGAITIPHAPWEARAVTPVGWADLLRWSTGITRVIWGIFVGSDEQHRPLQPTHARHRGVRQHFWAGLRAG